jgi:D-alanyl-D-alanine carboxypeptidase (penicillin-binding protein 5/6)
MSKLMTVYIVFSKLKDGSLSLDDTFTVSENAWRKGGAASGGSTMFLSIGDKVRVEDLLKGIIIQSGNDACIVVAENLSGSEEDFAVEMNKKAQELGMENSHFENATGLPHPDHRMSVEDLAKLARKIISDYPQFYHLFSQKEFVYHNIRQGNRNPLLYSMPYADGLKTGHTEEAGFCLTASAKKGDRRLIGVMTGLNSNKERSDEANKIMSWGFREFDNYTILKKGEEIAKMPVWYGKQDDVAMVVSEDVIRTLKKNKSDDVKIKVIYDKPVKAPIKSGDKLGIIKAKIAGQDDLEVPLVAANNVEKVGLWGRVKKNLQYLLTGAD